MPETLTWKEFFCVEKLNLLGQDLKHGEVIFHNDKCKGCRLCEQICFTGIIINSKTSKPEIKKGVGALCVSCGACTAICPEQAVELKEFIEFYRYFRWLDRDKHMSPRRF